ncbi:MAG: hypothetical protein LQ349_004365 [Xanthoria aureola]|nr:MAG: hypothetical protein LQ349_004365 [Xanthoria aureola]
MYALRSRTGFEGTTRDSFLQYTASRQLDRKFDTFPGQNLYFYNNHPIRWVRLVGVIVAFDVYPNRITITLDDSSGLNIEVFCKKDICTVTPTIDTSVDAYGAIKLNRPLVQKDDEHVVTTSEGKVNLDRFNVGSVVKIKGGVSEFRGEKQVTLERIALVRTTNEEAIAWAENSAFYQEVLCKPWVVDDRAQLRAKKRAAGLDKQREAKKGLKRRKRESAEKREKGFGTDHKRSRFGGDKTRATHDRLHVQARTR